MYACKWNDTAWVLENVGWEMYPFCFERRICSVKIVIDENITFLGEMLEMKILIIGS